MLVLVVCLAMLSLTPAAPTTTVLSNALSANKYSEYMLQLFTLFSLVQYGFNPA